jgi:hypothetical protein
VRRTPRLAAAALLALAASAPADEDAAPPAAPAPANDEQPTLRGEIRAGFQLISHEDQGRFPQDVALKDGFRIFELDVFGTDPRRDAPVDEMELRLTGVGDANSDYLLSLKKRGSFDVSGGYRRDAYDYSAAGDPFPLDAVRERYFVHGLWTPSGDAAVRFAWDANDRRGEERSYGYGFDASNNAASQLQPREIEQRTDRFTLGGDYAFEMFHFGVTQSVGIAHVDDERMFGPGASTDLSIRTNSYVTTGKAGVTLFDGALDTTLFVTRSRMPMDERVQREESVPSPQPFAGDGGAERDQWNWRLETGWRPHRDWEFTFAAERDDVVEDLDGTYAFVGQAVPVVLDKTNARVTDRSRRFSADATWDATRTLRLRLGEEYLREELFSPTDSHFRPIDEGPTSHEPTDLTSNSFRTTAGADWKPWSPLSLSALAHFSTNDGPQTTTVPRSSDDWTMRGKWKASDEVSTTTLWRYATGRHTGGVLLRDFSDPDAAANPSAATDLSSTNRLSSVSQSVAWAWCRWAVTGTGTYRRNDTTTDSAYGWKENGATTFETVSYSGRDVIVDLDVRYEILPTLRVFADAVRSNARDHVDTKVGAGGAHDSYPARRLDFSVGAEYDFGADVTTDGEARKNMTAGVKFSSWRLVDGAAPQDSYRVYGVEFSIGYRF